MKEILGIYNPFGAIIEESIPVRTFNEALGYFFELEETLSERFVTTALKDLQHRKKISKNVMVSSTLNTCE
jgi:hypothetical protein